MTKPNSKSSVSVMDHISWAIFKFEEAAVSRGAKKERRQMAFSLGSKTSPEWLWSDTSN